MHICLPRYDCHDCLFPFHPMENKPPSKTCSVYFDICLLQQHGCNSHKNGREQECGKEDLGSGVSELSALPDRFKPLPMTKDMDDQWLDLIKDIPL